MGVVHEHRGVDAEVHSIIELTQTLVRTPSQGGIDSLAPVFGVLQRWFSANGIDCRQLDNSAGEAVAIVAEVDSGRPGPLVCLDAPIDTAPAGKRQAWRQDPFSGMIDGNRIYGRGVADAKVGAAIFSHIARSLSAKGSLRRGKVLVLLDGDEHTGRFGGIRAFVETYGIRPDFVAVGYPGNYGVKIGARGFFRASIRVHGTERHSGSQADTRGQNAILKMARLVDVLSRKDLPAGVGDFHFGPKLSFTEISGGQGFSQIPGECRSKLDVRLTPEFSYAEARSLVQATVAEIDRAIPTERASEIEEEESWPAYRLSDDDPHVVAIRTAAEEAFKKRVELVVCGPSNIGNYLASHQIPSSCGFGVSYDYQHAANEYVDLTTIAPVLQTYHRAVLQMCGADWSSGAPSTIGPAS